jgi:RNA polymerase subunit RPABC4/transcription elongation factor Spt4
MQVCSSCQHELPEQGAFCPWCGAPVRCKSCESLLTPPARFCANCGAEVSVIEQSQAHSNGGNGASANGGNGVSAGSPAHNLIRFDQDGKTCHIEARLSDPAFEVGGKVLGLVMAARAGVSLKRGRRSQPTDGDEEDRQPTLLDYIDVEDDDQHEVKNVTTTQPQQKLTAALPQSDDETKLREIFRVTDDKELKVVNTRLKQNLKKDFVERLTVLFLYGHELLTQRESVPRDALKKVLIDTKVYDGNARLWLSKNDLINPSC